jgi:hypothetical protein
VWELQNGAGIQTLYGLRIGSDKIVFSPDDRYMAALSEDWQLAVWDLKAGRLLHVFDTPRGITADNAAVAFHPSEPLLAFSAGEEALIWDLRTAKTIDSWKLPFGLVDNLAFHQEPGKPMELLLFRVEMLEGKERPTNDQPEFSQWRIGRVRNLLGQDPTKPRFEISRFPIYVVKAGFLPDSSSVIVCGYTTMSGSQAVAAFDCELGMERWLFPTSDKKKRFVGFEMEPTGRRLAVSVNDGNENNIVLDTKTGQIIEELGPRTTRINRDGQFMITNDLPGAAEELYGLAVLDSAYRVLVRFSKHRKIYVNVFNTRGTSAAWCEKHGSIFIADLPEVKRNLAKYQLGR